MGEQHVQVWVNGHDVTCDTLAALSVKGGRSDFLAQPDPATCSLTVEWATTGQPMPRVGDPVQVAGWLPGQDKASTYRALFAGHITDLADEAGWVSLVAVDPMRRLQGVLIGDTPWAVPSATTDADLVYRLNDVWDALKANVLDPVDVAWMGNPFPRGVLGDRALPRNYFPANRDVDRQPGLDVLYEYLKPTGNVLFHMPTDRDPRVEARASSTPLPEVPQDPAQWKQGVKLVEWDGSTGVWMDYGPLIDACLIVGDPPPRRWQNLSTLVNEWEVTGYVGPRRNQITDATPRWEASIRAAQALIARYGPRSGKFVTQWQADTQGTTITPPTNVQAFLTSWLDRTCAPTWSVDGVNVVFTPDTMVGSRTDKELQVLAWRWLACQGPSVCALPVALGGLPSSRGDGTAFRPGAGSQTTPLTGRVSNWYVENTEFVWLDDGWQITLGCSDPAVYLGGVAHL